MKNILSASLDEFVSIVAVTLLLSVIVGAFLISLAEAEIEPIPKQLNSITNDRNTDKTFFIENHLLYIFKVTLIIP